jgi:DNA modification methylase
MTAVLHGDLAGYEALLRAKKPIAQRYGFACDPHQINPKLKPHQKAIVKWAVEGGRRAIFAAFGLGKSFMQLEILRLILAREGGRALIVCPLGVRIEFAKDAIKLDIELRFIRRTEQIDGDGLYITNYESVRDGKLDVDAFTAVSLDEASVLRSFGSKTYQEFLPLFDSIPYRFVATATPSPNRHKELIHYAGYLDIMDTGAALTRFFQRDSTQANNLTLYPHKRDEFFLWMNSWAIFLQRPSDLCRCTCHDPISTSKASASAVLSPSLGSPDQDAPAAGYVAAIAAPSASPRPTTSGADVRAAAAAFAPLTDETAPASTASGSGCSTAAADPTTRTGQTTAAAGSPSASAGAPSATSSPTWESRPTDTPSTASTTTGTTSPVTADGRPAQSRRTIADHAGEPCPCEDDGYELPELDLEWHEVLFNPGDTPTDRDGQGHLFRGVSMGLPDAAREKRESIAERVAEVGAILDSYGDDLDQVILWCDLNAEQAALEHLLRARGISYSSVYGSLDPDEVERRIGQWRDRETVALIGKPVMLGQGMNFQQCNKAIYVGLTFKFNDLIQSIHRVQRFGQSRTCEVHLIHTDTEREVVQTIRAKWAKHKELTATMTDIIREYGLARADIAAALERSLGIERVEASGAGWLLANNDCVPETASMSSDSVDLIVTSIPFANHYEYTPSYNDFGHTDNNEHFWAQMDYLTPELYRVLAPGRIYACHVKDRVLFGNVTGLGFPTVDNFHEEAVFHAEKHGFKKVGMITVVTDVVRENNQTYRLGWTENSKDSTKMGVGCPEYILLFRKPQTDLTRGYADTPVTKDKADYTRARWQIDAHAFWRSSGDRMLTPDELAALSVEDRSRLFTEQTLQQVYDYESHVRIGEQMEARGALPATFMSLAPGSWHEDVWHDVNRMRTLNGEQSHRAQVLHVCPLQFDIVERLIRRYSNTGELVFDPFAGLGTVPMMALRMGRRGQGVELNPGYWLDSVKYLEAEERSQGMPTLFDLEGLAS